MQKQTLGNASSKQRQKSSRINELVVWLAFEVLIAFVPLVLGVFALLVNDDNKDIANIIIHGGMALISVSIAAGVLGDLWISKNNKVHANRLWHDLAFIGCFLVAIFGSFWYFATANDVKNVTITSIGSFVLVITTLLVSGIGKWKAGGV